MLDAGEAVEAPLTPADLRGRTLALGSALRGLRPVVLDERHDLAARRPRGGAGMRRRAWALALLLLAAAPRGAARGDPGHPAGGPTGRARPRRRRGARHRPRRRLRALTEAGVPIDMIVGTSMGSLIGGLYAAGFDADDARRGGRRAVDPSGAAELLLPPRGGILDGRRCRCCSTRLLEGMALDESSIPFTPS
jgi:hypothetical protein